MNASFPFDLFMVYTPECRKQLRTMKYLQADTRYCIFYIWAVVLLLSESRGYCSILHGFILYTTVSSELNVKQSHASIV